MQLLKKEIEYSGRLKAVLCYWLIGALFLACNRKETEITPAFYYWKTTFDIPPALHSFINDLKIKKLYLRFFDVDWNNDEKKAAPIGIIHFNAPPDPSLAIVPVVYITNRTMEKVTGYEIQLLAQQIFDQVRSIANQQKIAFSELQLDCDWTEKSKENYFQLITSLKERLHASGKLISVTVRLHQVKYPMRSGVPNVDRAMLMFYNMGKLQTANSKNSIYNEVDAGKYTVAIKNYPLKLDVVLPCFSWAIHSRDTKVIGLLPKLMEKDFNLINFTLTGENTYKVNEPLFFQGEYLMKNDLLKLETITPELLLKNARQLSENIKIEERTVALFDLDSINVMRYEKENFEEAYNCFR